MDRRSFLWSTGASLVAASAPTSLPATALDESLESTLARIAEQALKDGATPGIQIAAWKNGRRAAEVVRGLANLETATPVTSSTIFRAGSLTKQVMAALMARLQDEGRLALGDPLDKYLDFFKATRVPTLLELIHHTAGVHTADEETCSQAPVTQVELALQIAAQEPLFDFPPGTAWLYSNANYILLGAVAEVVTGQPLATITEQVVFTPLGLTQTRFDHHADVVAHRASGYTGTEGGPTNFVHADFIAIEQTGGAGAMRSTARDLCRWHQALFYGPFLSAAARSALVEPATLSDGRPITQGRFDPGDNNMGETSYGYGLMLDRSTRDHGVIATHTGFVNGFSAYLATHLPSRTTVACMCNADPGPQLPFRPLRRAVFASFL